MSDFGITTSGYITEFVLEKLAEKVEFFMDSKLEPMIHISEDGFQQDWPVDSQRVLDLLIAVFHEVSLGEILKAREREFLLSQIRQKCRLGERRFTNLEVVEAEKNPIVQAILFFLNSHRQFEGPMADLLLILREFPMSDSFSQREQIPVFTSIFSRKLKQLIPVLSGYGVEVMIEHRNSGSYCWISRMESFVAEPVATLEQIDEGDDSEAVVTEPSPSRHP